MEFDLWSLQGQYTPVEDFYVRNHFAAPTRLEAATLKIEGEVEALVRLQRYCINPRVLNCHAYRGFERCSIQ